MHCDSQNALFLIQNSIYHARTKYINIRYHRIRELVEEREVELVKVHIKDNQADALTKALAGDSFLERIELMGLIDQAKFVKALRHQGGDNKLKCGASKPREVNGGAKAVAP